MSETEVTTAPRPLLLADGRPAFRAWSLDPIRGRPGRARTAHLGSALVAAVDAAVAPENHLLVDTGEAAADRHGHELLIRSGDGHR